jgi:SAM-dependent methyltransferase
VLDIGCANGALLQHFGPSWDRCGIEPSAPAAALAQSRGIRVLAPTIETLAPEERFDVILAIDVVEHIVDPLPFFARVARHLGPGGAFLLYTGDTGAPTWRLEGSRYWYCSLAEHVSFYDSRSLAEIGSRCGLRLESHRRMSHARTTVSDKTLCTIKNIAFLIGFYGRGFGVPPLRRLFLRHHAPSWMPAPDHMLVSMRPDPALADTPALHVEFPARRPASARA